MSAKHNLPGAHRFGPPTILEIDDAVHPPLPLRSGPLEERFRDLPTEEIQFLLNMNVMGPPSRAAAIAELARRGISTAA